MQEGVCYCRRTVCLGVGHTVSANDGNAPGSRPSCLSVSQSVVQLLLINQSTTLHPHLSSVHLLLFIYCLELLLLPRRWLMGLSLVCAKWRDEYGSELAEFLSHSACDTAVRVCDLEVETFQVIEGMKWVLSQNDTKCLLLRQVIDRK